EDLKTASRLVSGLDFEPLANVTKRRSNESDADDNTAPTSAKKRNSTEPGKAIIDIWGLSQEQALSYIPPSVWYPEDTSESRTTRFDYVPKFDGPNFTENNPIRIENDSYVAITVNIFL
ncbi:7911_t:CDS:2, partial [Dentiscutata erythropus]